MNSSNEENFYFILQQQIISNRNWNQDHAKVTDNSNYRLLTIFLTEKNPCIFSKQKAEELLLKYLNMYEFLNFTINWNIHINEKLAFSLLKKNLITKIKTPYVILVHFFFSLLHVYMYILFIFFSALTSNVQWKQPTEKEFVGYVLLISFRIAHLRDFF